MGVLALLEEARAAGLTVEARGDRLVIRGPRSAGPLARTLGESKAEILAILGDQGKDLGTATSGTAVDDRPRAGPVTDVEEVNPIDRPPDEAPPWRVELAGWTETRRESWEERAAIMEQDGGLAKDQAEHRAFMEATGRFKLGS